MPAGGVSPSAFNLTDDVPLPMQYFDWDRFDAQQGDKEAAEQGGAAGPASRVARSEECQ